MNEKPAELGDKVEDKVTKFKGVVIGITEWLYGCARAVVQPEGVNKEGKTFENQSFDLPSLKVLKRAQVTPASKDTGGPRATPRAKESPSRY